LPTKGQNPAIKENKQALINFFGDFIVKFNQSNPLVSPGNLYYIAGSFGNPEIVKVVSDQEVFDCPGIISLAHAPVLVTDFSVVNVHVDELSSARIW
jgi:hypothetical protein